MSSLLERSILMTIGAAALTKEAAESVANEFIQRGQETTSEGRQAVNETVEKAKDEARSMRDKLDVTMRETFQDIGLTTRSQFEDLELKVAQLEHRLSLLEAEKAGHPASGAKVEPEEEEPVTEG